MEKLIIESGIVNAASAKRAWREAADVYTVGKIDREIYKCISGNIATDEVILTDNQIKHIMDRHPDAYERAIGEIGDALANPDYIITDNKHKNTGLVIKTLKMETGNLQIVLRICTYEDEPGYKNSIISCWKISDKRLLNYLRNKRILYKK